MRLLTELHQLGCFTSSGTVGRCVLVKDQNKWIQASDFLRLEKYFYLRHYVNRAWIGLQYWSSSHRLKTNLFFSNMGDGSRNAL